MQKVAVALSREINSCVGEQIEIMKPDGQNVEVTVKRILNEDGEEQESAPHSKQILHVELEGGRAEAYDILRRKE